MGELRAVQVYSLLLTVFLNTEVSHPKYIGRTDCPEGKIFWPVDLTCHRPFSQGPCEPYQQLINNPEGPFCKNIQENSPVEGDQGDWSLGGIFPPSLQRSGWTLPLNESDLNDEELTCLAKSQVYWPEDGECYDLLAAGPCSSGEWLVLEKDETQRDRVVCKQRVCPCDPARPEFCEVEMKDGDCQCKVALAAAQDGLCDPGEQLLVNPYGFGVCGCITSPPHTTWPQDGKCYPLYTQGPCAQGFQLSIHPRRREPSCRPAICSNERSVLWEDGTCYHLGERGPCEQVEVLTIDEETLKPRCKLNQSQVKRVFDTLPGGFVRNGPISINLKARNCDLNREGKCRNSFQSDFVSRKRGNEVYVRQRSGRSYMSWLKSFN